MIFLKEQDFKHPIYLFCLDIEKANILIVPFNNCWSVNNIHIMYFFGIISQNFEPFWLNYRKSNSSQAFLNFIGRLHHFFEIRKIFSSIFLFIISHGSINKRLLNTITLLQLFMFFIAIYTACMSFTFRTCVFAFRLSTDTAYIASSG